MLKYMLNCFDEARGKEFINQLRTHLTPQLETELMTIGEQLRQEGIQQGMQQGIHKGEYAFLHRLLQRKFQHVPQNYLDKMGRADADTLLKWGESVLDANDLTDIFDE